MRVLALPKYGPKGPSSRVRFFQYLPFLKDLGAEFEVAPLLDDAYVDAIFSDGKFGLFDKLSSYFRRMKTLRRIDEFDVVWMENEFLHFLPFYFESTHYRKKPRVVVNYDDAVFHRYEYHGNPFVRWILGRKIDRVMAEANHVVVGNSYLEERARQAGASRISVLPSVIDLEEFPGPTFSTGDVGELVLGWIGTPNTVKFLDLVREPLINFSRENHCRLEVMGVPSFKMPEIEVTSVPWEKGAESQFMERVDVGLMPLVDEPFERGKCGYKLIQYLAAGKPVIASPVGVNRDIVQPEVGILAGSDLHWLEAFRAMLNHKREGRLTTMGQEGRRRVESCFSVQATVQPLWSILSGGT